MTVINDEVEGSLTARVVMGTGGRVQGVTVSDPISFFMMIAWFCWMATRQSFNSVSTSGSTTKWVEKTNKTHLAAST